MFTLKKLCCPFIHSSNIVGTNALHLLLLCELQHLPAPCYLAWSNKQLFSIYPSTAEAEHSLWWNGTSPSGPEKLACRTEIVMTDTFLGKACFVISPFYRQKTLSTSHPPGLSIIFSDRKDITNQCETSGRAGRKTGALSTLCFQHVALPLTVERNCSMKSSECFRR